MKAITMEVSIDFFDPKNGQAMSLEQRVEELFKTENVILVRELGKLYRSDEEQKTQLMNDVTAYFEKIAQSVANLKIVREGSTPLASVTLEVWVNGQITGTYPFEVGFEKIMKVGGPVELRVRCGGITTPIKLNLNPGENYTCKISYSTSFYYELYNESGALLKEDKLGIGMWILSFIIPLVGIIYFFVKRQEYPVKAKNALIAGIIGFIVAFVFL